MSDPVMSAPQAAPESTASSSSASSSAPATGPASGNAGGHAASRLIQAVQKSPEQGAAVLKHSLAKALSTLKLPIKVV